MLVTFPLQGRHNGPWLGTVGKALCSWMQLPGISIMLSCEEEGDSGSCLKCHRLSLFLLGSSRFSWINVSYFEGKFAETLNGCFLKIQFSTVMNVFLGSRSMELFTLTFWKSSVITYPCLYYEFTHGSPLCLKLSLILCGQTLVSETTRNKRFEAPHWFMDVPVSNLTELSLRLRGLPSFFCRTPLGSSYFRNTPFHPYS